MAFEMLNIQTVDEKGRNMLIAVQKFNALRPQIRELCPGYDLAIVKIENDAQPSLISVPESVKPDAVLQAYNGIDRIAFVLQSGPMEKGKLLGELARKGVVMSMSTLTVYLSRGKKRGLFDNAAGAMWGLRSHITDGSEHFHR
jgi:hypothetical protein